MVIHFLIKKSLVNYALVGVLLPTILIVEDSGSGELSEKNNSQG